MQNIYRFIFLPAAICLNYQIQSALLDEKAQVIMGQLGDSQVSQEKLNEKWFTAAKMGDLKTIEELCDKVDVNITGEQFETALICAVINGRENVVHFLLQIPNINVNAQTKYGETALKIAASRGLENIVKLLLDTPAINVNAQNKRGWNALMSAVHHNHEAIVKLLVQVPQININAHNAHRSTALIVATEQCDTNLVKLLCAVPGIDLNAEDKEGCTALLCAILMDDAKTVKFLLEVPGIYIMVKDAKGTPLSILDYAKQGDSEEIVQLIKNHIDLLKLKAFDAIKFNNLEMLKWVITQMGDSIIDENGDTLLDKACFAHRTEIIQFLLQYTADPRLLLSRFPFELLNPTSPVFKFFIDLAFGELSHSEKSCRVCAQIADKYCGKCKQVYYCSNKCQKADWESHKIACKR